MSVLTELRQLRSEVGDFISRHEQAQSVTDFAKYANDPEGFYRDVLRATPWRKQVEMAERVRDKPQDKTGVLCVTANGLGKDWATAHMALWWVYARQGMVILTGPGERQVKEILMREVRKAFARAPELPGELFALKLDVGDDCGILAFTSDNAEKLVGYHHPRLLICVTEGQGVEAEAYEAAQACCTGAKNRLFVYGNPTAPTGPFYQAATEGRWDVLTIRADEHPNVVSGQEQIPGATSREWIAIQRDEYGENSSIYRSRVLAEFPEDAIEGLVKREWLRAAFDRYESGTLDTQMHSRRTILAVDVARFGPDSTVLAVVRGPVVTELIKWRGLSITDTADRVADHAQRLETQSDVNPKWARMYGSAGAVQIIVDTPGLGGGLVDVLKRKGLAVTEFNGAARALDPRRFINTRAESHWKFRELLQNNRVALPRDKALEEEALAVEWTLAKQEGSIQILSKDTIREKLKRSPDTLDAIVIGLGHSMGGLSHTASFFTFAI